MHKFLLVDKHQELVDAWKYEFRGHLNFEFYCGDIFDKSADYIVSPANSFGFMDGGIDLAYSLKMGWHVQSKLQEKIKTEYNCELLVGQATVIDTDFAQFPKMIAAPTMRVPMYLEGSPNVYLCAKAIFLTVKNAEKDTITLIPGLGTGTGMVNYKLCAQKMRLAYEDFYCESPDSRKYPIKLLHANIKHLEELT